MEIENLRTLNNETHCRIRTIEERLEEMQTDVSDNSTDEDENDDQMIEENRARMVIIQKNAKNHCLKTNENQKISETMQQKTNINE